MARLRQLESEAERARKMDEEVKGEDLVFKTCPRMLSYCNTPHFKKNAKNGSVT